MNDIKYGLISQTDSKTIEATADCICNAFSNELIMFTEVGIYAGLSGYSIKRYFKWKGFDSVWTGVENFKDNEKLVFTPDKLIVGNSTEVYNQIPDNSQHLLFIDGDHSYIGVISDFYAYKDKVKVGGFLAFHDTGVQIKPFTDFQHGDKENPDAYISVRKALEAVGLIGYRNKAAELLGWKLVFDEADLENRAGGICVFKKLY